MPKRKEKRSVARPKNGNVKGANPYIANEFKDQDTWRTFRIMSEFVEGFEALRNIRPAVTLFGSARTLQNPEDYQMARKIGYGLSKKGFSIITGGGTGVM